MHYRLYSSVKAVPTCQEPGIQFHSIPVADPWGKGGDVSLRWLAECVTRQFWGFRPHQNQERPGFRPLTQLGGGSLQHSCRPHSWWGGGWLPAPHEPNPASTQPPTLALWASNVDPSGLPAFSPPSQTSRSTPAQSMLGTWEP